MATCRRARWVALLVALAVIGLSAARHDGPVAIEGGGERPAILGAGPVSSQTVIPAAAFFRRFPPERTASLGLPESLTGADEPRPGPLMTLPGWSMPSLWWQRDLSFIGPRNTVVFVLLIVFYTVIAMVCIYIARHYIFTLNRLFQPTRQPYLDIDTADWPPITVLVPAHNEAAVIGDILEAILDADYPRDRLTVIPIDDRSKDRTREIVQAFAAGSPGVVRPYLRDQGKPGKAAALNDAMRVVTTDVALVFDADYIPGRGLLKQLVAPFFDPEVGAVMGRVVPHNITRNLLSRLLDLERSGGYQVDQQARMNLHLVPQYGGTVGGVRVRALRELGGWRDDSLTEDTDATYRLLLEGWKTVYQNRSECYEQVPEDWDSRLRQIRRWAMGHNEVAVRHVWGLLASHRVSVAEKLDGALLLGVYTMSPILVLGWLVGIVLWYLGVNKPGLIIILLVVSYNALGNFATFFEIASAAHLDGSRHRIRLLPFVFLGFLVSLFTVARATVAQLFARRSKALLWHKTERGNGNGHGYRLANGFNGGSHGKSVALAAAEPVVPLVALVAAEPVPLPLVAEALPLAVLAEALPPPVVAEAVPLLIAAEPVPLPAVWHEPTVTEAPAPAAATVTAIDELESGTTPLDERKGPDPMSDVLHAVLETAPAELRILQERIRHLRAQAEEYEKKAQAIMEIAAIANRHLQGSRGARFDSAPAETVAG